MSGAAVTQLTIASLTYNYEKGCGLNNFNEYASALIGQASTNVPEPTVSAATTRFTLFRSEEEIEKA